MTAKSDQLRILTYPHPALRTPAEPIQSIDEEVRQVAQRMLQLMHEARGVGLAAPQVGLGWRLFVANPTGEPDGDQVFINPTLSSPARQTDLYDEGCLSLPNIICQIMRPVAITIDATGLDGQPFQLTAEGLVARVWQHEYDHLDGRLIIDRMTPNDRLANQRALRELEHAGK